MLDLVFELSWVSKLDLSCGYHQVRICKGDEWKIIFKIKDDLYKWLVIPSGLTTTQATFMQLISQVLKPFLGKLLFVYFDDILIFCRNHVDHIQHLLMTFELLRKESLLLKSKKCSFLENPV